MSDWLQIGGFWVSIFMALIAISAVLISFIVYRSSNAPDVIVYPDDDKWRPTIIILVIENIGRGPAKNVTFAPSRDLPKKAWGFEDAKMPHKMNEGPIVTGIPYLAPGARRVINWGQFGGLSKWFEDSTIDIEVSFERCDSIPFLKNRISNVSTVDVTSFASTDASDDNWDKKIAEELKSLNTNVKKLVAAIERIEKGRES
ncbi:hypothetical protein MYX82_02820 [Acidobacteria bacterium AH-259-D05]|nr:hypothetical protein [Acidobacteria bacterium AH-259-D05]